MTIQLAEQFLLYSLLINFGFLLFWFSMIVFAKKIVYGAHSKWFDIPANKLDAIHYSMMGYYKLTIIFFNLVPYFVLLSID